MELMTQINIFFYLSLFAFGTLFGSFSSVIIYRLKSGEKGIMTGRSHCGSCNTILKALDLVPVFSWLFRKWKCAYCEKKVSAIYPFLELSAWILFALIWYFLIDFTLILTWDILEITKLIFWCFIGILSIIYIFYDILFLEIHEGIMATGIWITLTALVAQTLIQDFTIIPHLSTWVNIYSNEILYWSIGLTFWIIALLYVIMLKWFDEIIDIALLIWAIIGFWVFKIFLGVNITEIVILNGLIWALAIFMFFFLQIFISKGAWLGGGDLRIAIMIWLALGSLLTFPGMMMTYMIGSVLSLGYLGYEKLHHKNKGLDTQIPFGPFLALWFFATIFFQKDFLKLMEIYF